MTFMYPILFVLFTTLLGSTGGILYAHQYYGPDPGEIAPWLGAVCGVFGMMVGFLLVAIYNRRNVYQPVAQSIEV